MKAPENKSFANLFRKYRLKSEVPTLSEFGDMLAQEGLTYEDSLFTRWQRGERIPKDRRIVLTMISIFAKRKGLNTVSEANALLASAEMRDLSKEEMDNLHLFNKNSSKKVNHLKNKQYIEKTEVTLNFFDTIWQDRSTALLTGYYFAILLWFIFLYGFNLKHSSINLAFGFAFGLIPMMGGIMGVFSSRPLLRQDNMIGKALFYLSCGLISWSIGECIWSIYMFFFKIEIPFPSLADLGYVNCAVFWGIGMYYLSFATRIKQGLKKNEGKILILVVPVLAVLISYYLLVVVARGGKLYDDTELVKIIFDLAYPFFDVVLLTEAVLIYGLSFRFIKGRYRWLIMLVLGAIVVNYFGDFSFSYTEATGLYYNGSWTDMLFATSMYLMGIVVNGFSAVERQVLITMENKNANIKVKKLNRAPNNLAILINILPRFNKLLLKYFYN